MYSLYFFKVKNKDYYPLTSWHQSSSLHMVWVASVLILEVSCSSFHLFLLEGTENIALILNMFIFFTE